MNTIEQIEKMYCVDPWNQDPIYEETFDSRLRPFIESRKCIKLKEFSEQASQKFSNNSIDMSVNTSVYETGKKKESPTNK